MTTHGFSKEQIAEFREHFTEVDTDKSGKVDAKELKAVMEKCGVEASDAQIKDLIKECGSSATELDFESFLNLMWKMQSGPSEKEVRNEMFTVSGLRGRAPMGFAWAGVNEERVCVSMCVNVV